MIKILCSYISETVQTSPGDIFIDASALVKCESLETNIFNTGKNNLGNVFINGCLTDGYFGEELNVQIKSSNLHVGIDAILGDHSSENQSKRSTNNDDKHSQGQQTTVLNLDIVDGGLTNFGSLLATDCIKLSATGISLCSESHNRSDMNGIVDLTVN